MRKIRIRDVPFFTVNPTGRAYLLREGVLSDASGFVPYYRGGYRRAPQWSVHGTPYLPTIIGASQAGAIATGETPQITATLKNASTNNIQQFRFLANGTCESWGGNQYGSNQDTTRDVVKYFRYDGAEYVLGWDLDTQNLSGKHGCGLFRSMSNAGFGDLAWPVGGEVMNASGIILTASSTGGVMGKGWVRFYFTYRTNKKGISGGIEGAPDHDNKKDIELTGNNTTNKVTISNLPPGDDPGTDAIYIYRTPVVSNQAQLDFAPAYFYTGVADTAGSVDVNAIPDSDLVKRARLELNRYSFPTMKKHGKYVGNLALGAHLGHLFVCGVLHDYRVYFSGYTDNDGDAVLGEDYWQYFLNTPERDTIVSAVSGRGKMFVLGKNGLYKVNDEYTDPAMWTMQTMASLHGGVSPRALVLSGQNIFVVARGLNGEWGIWATDGYNLEPVGGEMSLLIDENTGIVDFDGQLMLVGTEAARGYIRSPYGAWGRANIPAGTVEMLGRTPTFRNNAQLLMTPTAIMYERGTYSNDETDMVVTREYVSPSPEERSEWETLFIFANKFTDDCVLKVYGAVDGGDWIPMTGTEGVTVAEKGGGIIRLGVPPALRHGRRFKVKIVAQTSVDVNIERVSLQLMEARGYPTISHGNGEGGM